MAKTQEEIEKARMGEDDACADESCNEKEALERELEGARKVKEEEAYHSFAKTERNKEMRAIAEREEREATEKESKEKREKKARELKERMDSERGERLKARVKGNLKSGIMAIGESVVGGARDMAVKAVTPQKDGYLPQSRGGFDFPQIGKPVLFSQKPQSRKEKKSQRVHAKVVTGKIRPFSSGVGMHVGGPIGTGMSFVPPSVPRFGSPATPKSTFSMPFPRADIKSPRFGESHLGKGIPKREFTRGMRLDIDFSSSPFGKKKTNPLKGKKGGLW